MLPKSSLNSGLNLNRRYRARLTIGEEGKQNPEKIQKKFGKFPFSD
jgi:hypothetical protein